MTTRKALTIILTVVLAVGLAGGALASSGDDPLDVARGDVADGATSGSAPSGSEEPAPESSTQPSTTATVRSRVGVQEPNVRPWADQFLRQFVYERVEFH